MTILAATGKGILTAAIWLYRRQLIQAVTHRIPGRRHCQRDGASCSQLIAAGPVSWGRAASILGVTSVGAVLLAALLGCGNNCPPGATGQGLHCNKSMGTPRLTISRQDAASR